MSIRTYQAGDESAQVSIYNEAAADLPKYKPATLDEVRRRLRAPDFDPGTRLYAIENGRPVGYATFAASGRIGFPWCRKGAEQHREPLLEAVLEAMKQRALSRAWAAYRGDWAPLRDFFMAHGFQQVGEYVNFVVDLCDLPTPAARPSTGISAVTREDVPALLALGKDILLTETAADLEKYLFHNPYFKPDSCFVLRNKTDNQPLALSLVIANPAYGDPKQVDAAMPCFRLGAFGTEGLTTKRLNGLFSFLVPDRREANLFGLELLSHAANQLDETDVSTLAAQVASDVPHLLRFYSQYFRRQGSFPIYERTL
jgi:hypothetical protein